MFATAMVMAVALIAAFTFVPPAHAAENLGAAGLDWAEAHATGCWYAYGGTDCAQGYDCSGLVSSSILHATGIWIGRDTYQMLDNPHLHQIPLADAQRGDLLFYGTGHVEFDTEWYHTSFGAHDWGTRVGWVQWGGWWSPTMAFEVW